MILRKIFEKGIVTYEEMIQCICECAPDQKVQEVLVGRLNALRNPSDFNIQISGKLSAVRQWGIVKIDDNLRGQIDQFIQGGERLAWLANFDGIKVIGNKI
jgi:hypothetical protein